MSKLVESTPVFPYEEELAFAALQENFINSTASKVLILDIDETVMNSVPVWHTIFSRLLKKRGHNGDIPTLAQLTEKGGTDHVYNSPEFFSQEEYQQLMAICRTMVTINMLGPITEPGIAHILTELKNYGVEPIGSITSRPNNKRVLAATYSLLRKVNLPDMPVVARPEREGAYFQSANWKIDYLEKLVPLDPNKRIIIIDDSVSLAKDMLIRNSNKPQNEHIIQILYPGMNSVSKIEAGEIAEKPELGVFVSNWASITETIHRIHAAYTIDIAA